VRGCRVVLPQHILTLLLVSGMKLLSTGNAYTRKSHESERKLATSVATASSSCWCNDVGGCEPVWCAKVYVYFLENGCFMKNCLSAYGVAQPQHFALRLNGMSGHSLPFIV